MNNKEKLPIGNKAFYVFDIPELKNRITYIRSFFPDFVDLCYAVKANTFIVKEMIDSIGKFEICSPGEYFICEKLNVPLSRMVISGVYKTPSFLEYLFFQTETSCVLTVESMLQLSLIKELSEKTEKRVRILLRLTNGSQFGINAAEIKSIISEKEKLPLLDIIGIQFFSGTQKTSVKKIKRELEKIDNLISELKEEYGFSVRELEYGTGFPVTYFDCEDFDEEALFRDVAEMFCGMQNKTRIVIELGRSIAASCGKYYTPVVDMKTNKDMNYLLVDGGMHHISYFGQYMAMKQPFVSVVGKENEEAVKSWNICGSLCSMNDILVKNAALPEIGLLDYLCFERTGAYCATEGISLFLSRDLPLIYALDENGNYICLRESYETMALNMPEY